MTTIKDVAKKAGVSISTASYALNNRPNVHPKTKEKILLAAKELKYHPNGNARNLKTKKSGNIGVFIYGFAGPIFSEVLDGIHLKLQECGFNIIVSSGNSSLNLLLERQVDAAIVFDNKLSDRDLILYAENGSPIYVLDRILKGKNIYSSVIDNEGLVYRFIKEQIAKGYKDFAYLSGPEEAFNNQHRYVGFKQALEESHLPHMSFTGDFTIHGGYECGQKIAKMAIRPSFIYCANDEMAVGLLNALSINNIKVPTDIAIAGFDNIPLGNYTQPRLSTIAIDHTQWGRDVAEAIIKTLTTRQEQETLKPQGHFIMRESC